jgi:hypothetical protein
MLPYGKQWFRSVGNDLFAGLKKQTVNIGNCALKRIFYKDWYEY